MRLFTIGHSNLDVRVLIGLLRRHGVRSLCDVRAFPGSRRHPQFAKDALRAALEDAGIAYHWLGAELGGYRKGRREDSPHRALATFRAYADHMETDGFREGVLRLLAIAREAPAAFLCAERDWRGCHRRLLSDHLVALEGMEVAHIVDAHRTEAHALDPRARRDGDRLVYDAGVQGELF